MIVFVAKDFKIYLKTDLWSLLKDTLHDSDIDLKFGEISSLTSARITTILEQFQLEHNVCTFEPLIAFCQKNGGFIVAQQTSNAPETCQICGEPFADLVVDGKTLIGPWAWMCLQCCQKQGFGLGIGCGQLYAI